MKVLFSPAKQKYAVSIFLAAASLNCVFAGVSFAGDIQEGTLSETVYQKAEWIFEHTTETHYQHLFKPATAQVSQNGPDQCQIDTDCSGFVSYLINNLAPEQYKNVLDLQPDHAYPQAKTFTEFFLSLGDDARLKGWHQLKNYQDLRRGDFIAWAKPIKLDAGASAKKGNTGHVMLVAAAAGNPVTETIEGQLIRYIPIEVIDCSSVSHFSPETLPPQAHQTHRDGLGKGTVRLILNGDNQISGYWEGTFSNVSQRDIKHPTYTSDIALARIEPISRQDQPQTQLQP